MPTVAVNGLDLYYEVAGEGPPLLFIGGTGGDLRQKPNVFDGPLARRFTVAVYDQRGLGRTSKPDEPATMTQYGADAAALLDHLGWTGAAVVGVSFGGMVAQHLVLDRPDLVGRLVLCCTSSGGAGGASYPLHELAELDPEERARAQLGISDTRRGAAWQAANPEKAASFVAGALAQPAPGADDPDKAMGARRQLEARAGHDTFGRLGSITAPTLVCAGRYDGIAPVANSEALAAAIPGARLEVYEGGHLFLLQDRSAWPAILDFLAAAP